MRGRKTAARRGRESGARTRGRLVPEGREHGRADEVLSCRVSDRVQEHARIQ
jgi:hypothetical protein